MLPIVVAPPSTVPVSVEVVLPSGVTLRLPLEAEVAQVARWVQALARC